MITVSDEMLQKAIEPVKARNNKIYDQTQMARKDYFSTIISGGDVSNYSVVFPSLLSEVINYDLRESPYLMMVKVSITEGIQTIAKNLVFQVNDRGNMNAALYRLAAAYQMELFDEYFEEETRYALNEGFALESLYLESISPQEGQGVVDNLQSIDEQLNFLYWVGEKIPILILVDEISSSQILPAENTGIPIDDVAIKTIAALREKSKDNTYRGINKVKPYLLIPKPSELDAESNVMVKVYQRKAENDAFVIPTSPEFRSTTLESARTTDVDGNEVDFKQNGKLINFKFAGTTNFVIFTEDEFAINKSIVEASHFESIEMPEFDLRMGYITFYLYEFQESHPDVSGFRITVGDGDEGTLTNIATQLSGLTTRQIREVINKELSVNYSLLGQNEDKYVEIYLSNLARSRNKMINNTVALNVIENDLSFDDIEGLHGQKEFFLRVIEVLASDPKYHEFLSNVLLLGPPGTGKTLTANAVANMATKLGYTGIEFNIDELLGKYVGDTELNTRTSLKRLEATERALVWTDEIDRKLPDTELKSESGDGGVTNRMATMLMEFWGANIGNMLFLAGSNNPQNIPTATMDRFFIRLCLLPPDRVGRQKLFALKFKQLQEKNDDIEFVPNIDFIAEVCARKIGDVGGRPIENIVRMMSMLAMNEDGVIIDERKVKQILSTTNVRYGDKQDEMVKQALRFANPLSLLNTDGVLAIIRYANSTDKEEQQMFKPLKKKIEKIIEHKESGEELEGSFLDVIMWDMDAIKQELKSIESSPVPVAKKKSETTI